MRNLHSKSDKPPRKRSSEDRADGSSLPRAIREEIEATAGRSIDAAWFLGKALEALAGGVPAEALEHAIRAKDSAARSPTVREALGVAAYLTGDFKQAQAELSAFRRLSGTKVRDLYIADCYRAEGRPIRALELLDEIAAPMLADAARVRAGALHDSGDEAGAQAVLRLAGLESESIRPAGFLPAGQVGKSAGSGHRKPGRR